jgi:2'-5' RNA ligase
MRLFIAIPLPEEIKDEALIMQKSLDNNFRMTKNDQIHLTIAFLSEKPDAQSIIKKLENIRFKQFTMKTRGHGFFPSINKVRVVWIGLEENEEFIRLQHKIRSLFDFKEKLMPHITIARAKELIIDKENQWSKRLSEVKHDEVEFLVDKFILFESIPEANGHVHKQIMVFNADKV